MHSESLLTLDPTTLFYFNLTRGRNQAPESFTDVVKRWIAGVEPPSRPASRASSSETFPAASKLEPDDVHMGGISDDEEIYGTECEYSLISPPRGNTRVTSSRRTKVEYLDPDDVVNVRKKPKARVTNNDLPVGAHHDDRFRHAYVPSNIWWMAFQPDPFKAEVDAQVSFMRTSWKVIYGNTVPHKVRVKDPVFRLVKQRLSDSWRSRIGSAAISVVNAFFESEEVASLYSTDDSRQQVAKTMLKDFKFLYSDTTSSNPKKWKGLFRSRFVVQTFNAHFIAIAGAVKIEAYGDPKEAGQLPYGGLALSAAAVERAFKLYEIGAITIEIVEASRRTSKISFKPVLNKATGKTSANSFAFNNANWGSATRGYLESARDLADLRPDRFMEIMEMACSFSKAKSTPGDRPEHSEGEHTADWNDIRANLVDWSDDENDKDGDKGDGDCFGEEHDNSENSVSFILSNTSR